MNRFNQHEIQDFDPEARADMQRAMRCATSSA